MRTMLVVSRMRMVGRPFLRHLMLLLMASGSGLLVLVQSEERHQSKPSAINDVEEAPSFSIGLRHPFRAIDLLNARTRRNKKLNHQQTMGSTDPTNNSAEGNDDDDVQELYFEQTLDHFRTADSRTFAQRYFYTSRYAAVRDNNSSSTTTNNNSSKSIAFVCVGGEGPALTKRVLIDSVHCTGDMLYTAEKLFALNDNSQGNTNNNNLNIHLFALEHRYYGNSYPIFDDNDDPSAAVTNENLVYLSSRQAAADLAHFIAHQIHPLLSTNATTILFGGSYPGMLAAFARSKYPHLVTAAVSNSAPVQAVLDFASYNNHVARDLLFSSTTDDDDDDLCLRIVETGHAALGARMEEEFHNSHHHGHPRQQQLAEQFRLCNASTALDLPRNVQLWIGDGVIPLNAQGNDPACTHPKYCNLAQTCAALEERYREELLRHNATTSAVQTLAWMVSQVLDDDDDCITVDWQGTLDYISNPQTGMVGGLRSWLYQTCTEFGFYQSCERGSTCPYARGWHPLSQDLELCAAAFGVAPHPVVARAVQAANEWSGGWRLASSTTNILSVTGTMDPWSELAITHKNSENSSSSSSLVYEVPGASHHFWTHPVRPTDDPRVMAAREHIYRTVAGDWLMLGGVLDDGDADHGGGGSIRSLID